MWPAAQSQRRSSRRRAVAMGAEARKSELSSRNSAVEAQQPQAQQSQAQQSQAQQSEVAVAQYSGRSGCIRESSEEAQSSLHKRIPVIQAYSSGARVAEAVQGSQKQSKGRRSTVAVGAQSSRPSRRGLCSCCLSRAGAADAGAAGAAGGGATSAAGLPAGC